MGDCLARSVPAAATVCRYSGDEFAVALPGVRLDEAFTLAEEIRRRIAAFAVDGSPEARITTAIGLAAYLQHGDNDIELIRAVDQALFLAKQSGGNRVALPLTDARMVTKTSHYSPTQLDRLAQLARTLKRTEATLLREALDDLLKRYNDQLGALPQPAAPD